MNELFERAEWVCLKFIVRHELTLTIRRRLQTENTNLDKGQRTKFEGVAQLQVLLKLDSMIAGGFANDKRDALGSLG